MVLWCDYWFDRHTHHTCDSRTICARTRDVSNALPSLLEPASTRERLSLVYSRSHQEPYAFTVPSVGRLCLCIPAQSNIRPLHSQSHRHTVVTLPFRVSQAFSHALRRNVMAVWKIPCPIYVMKALEFAAVLARRRGR